MSVLERDGISVLWHREIWCTTSVYQTEISQADMGGVLMHLQDITRNSAMASSSQSFSIIFAAENVCEHFGSSLAELNHTLAHYAVLPSE